MQKQPHAVITGATHGIGSAIAKHLLAAGFRLSICARNAGELSATAAEWQAQYPGQAIQHLPADVSIKSEVEAFARLALGTGDVDILVNNAGAFLQGDVATEPEGQLQTLLDTNLMSAYHLTRALLPKMKAQGSGHIFNICSIASLKAYPGGGAYSISKYALLGFSDNLREELKPTGIRVTAICPGAVWTNSWSSSGIEPTRIMEAEDIAKMLWAAYTLSNQANVENIVLRPTAGDL